MREPDRACPSFSLASRHAMPEAAASFPSLVRLLLLSTKEIGRALCNPCEEGGGQPATGGSFGLVEISPRMFYLEPPTCDDRLLWDIQPSA
jgi:hypothetical protein